MSEHAKLQAFVEAATSNPKHPIFQLGLRHSPMLQNYAVNVQMLGAISAEQWFKDYPHYTAKLEEVMKLCEEDEAERLAEAERSGENSAKVKTLEATVARLEATVAKLTAAKTEAAKDETETETESRASSAAGGDEDEPFDGMEDE